jgi:hypothetical protein
MFEKVKPLQDAIRNLSGFEPEYLNINWFSVFQLHYRNFIAMHLLMTSVSPMKAFGWNDGLEFEVTTHLFCGIDLKNFSKCRGNLCFDLLHP